MNFKKARLGWIFVLALSFLPSAFAADQKLDASQFKAPPSTAPTAKKLPSDGVIEKDKTIPQGITGLQSDALLKQFEAAPNRVNPTSEGENRWVCPRGYQCTFSGQGSCGLPPHCNKYPGLSIWNNGSRGVCVIVTVHPDPKYGDASCYSDFQPAP